MDSKPAEAWRQISESLVDGAVWLLKSGAAMLFPYNGIAVEKG
jgi:hypothetical protein